MSDPQLINYENDENFEDTKIEEPHARTEMAYDEESIKYSITTFGKDIDVDGYVKRLANNSIIKPDYQRKYVWKTARASLLIESLYIGLPVPQLFFYEEPDGGWSIIDGLQRLTTLRRFYNDDFTLKAPGLSEDLRGKKYSSLSPLQKRRLDDASIRAIILRQDKPERDKSSVYRLFHRINTQSSPLSAQEIRSCVNRGDFNDLLVELNSNEYWRGIFGSEHSRLKDRELILRFFALHTSYKKYKPPMTRYLDDFMDDKSNISTDELNNLRNLFQTAIELIWKSKGTEAFRPKSENKALIITNFDSVMHAVATAVQNNISLDENNLKKLTENILKNKKYIYGTDEFTNDKDRVEARLEGAQEELQSL